MAYGIKLYNSAGNSLTLSPDDGTIIAAGSVTMSNSLEGDNTYGEDISLGATYDEDEIAVMVAPRRPNYNVTYDRYIDGTLYYNSFYLDSNATYYTRNDSTGVMTSFSAGNKTVEQRGTWDSVLSVFPIAFWDKKGATTFSSIRLFAATAYLIRDSNNDTNFCLAGSATGSGGMGGYPATNINDDNESTLYGAGCGVILGNSCSWSYWAEVTFSSKTVNRAEILHRPWSSLLYSNYANGWYKVELYYSSAYHQVLYGSWSGNYAPCPPTEGIISYATGHWKGVTKIKVSAAGSAQSGGASDYAGSEHVTWELRAWGPASSDDSENKVVYSIGSNGISTVDYLICRKRYT